MNMQESFQAIDHKIVVDAIMQAIDKAIDKQWEHFYGKVNEDGTINQEWFKAVDEALAKFAEIIKK